MPLLLKLDVRHRGGRGAVPMGSFLPRSVERRQPRRDRLDRLLPRQRYGAQEFRAHSALLHLMLILNVNRIVGDLDVANRLRLLVALRVEEVQYVEPALQTVVAPDGGRQDQNLDMSRSARSTR
ncbi:hypothetical protein JT362_31655 [Actinophytocola sp. S1-96]|uniref:Uncharacterized protein n=1 Tax=Actinophytocola gossypii TaxID=2812003 RepID=A0ABT2JIH6_9PSEU|nr:hypothetical protein [Actinophytocola gossypii]MCT2587684.1 hypothetical protein [Actinophytocola gossypii]